MDTKDHPRRARWGKVVASVVLVGAVGGLAAAGAALLLTGVPEGRRPTAPIQILSPIVAARGDAAHASWGGTIPAGRLRVAWRHTDPSGPPFTAALAANGMIFTSSDALHALGRDGELRWTFSPPGHVSAPVLVDQLVVVSFVDPATATLHVRALEQRSGGERWRFSHPAPDAVYARVAASSDAIVIASDVTGSTNVWMLRTDGGMLWSATAKGSPMEYPPALGRDVVALATQPPVRFDFRDGHTNLLCDSVEYLHHGGTPFCRGRPNPRLVEVFDATSGAWLWGAPGAAERTGPPVIAGDVVVTVARRGIHERGPDRLVVYAVATGERVASEADPMRATGQFGVSGKTAYVRWGSGLSALMLPRLEERWRVPNPGAILAMLPTPDGVVLALGEEVRLLRPGVDGGRIATLPRTRGTFFSGLPNPVAMTSTGGALLVATYDRELFALIPERAPTRP